MPVEAPRMETTSSNNKSKAEEGATLSSNNLIIQITEEQTYQEETEDYTLNVHEVESITVAMKGVEITSESITTTPRAGYLNNLTVEQRQKLFQLWSMLLVSLAQKMDSDTDIGGKKKKEHATELFRKIESQPANTTQFTFTEGDSTAFDANPLTSEFFCQSSTEDVDRTMLRFLRARKWSVIDAYLMFMDNIKWRLASNIRKLMMEGERGVKSSLLEGGKNYFWKNDKEGRLVCYIRSRLHDKNAQTLQESVDFTIYTVETGRRLRSHEDQLVTVVFDLKNAPLCSLDIGALQFMIQALQSFYPEILGKCLILEAPWIFSGFWKMIRPLLDPVVASKIEFIKTSDLPKYIDSAALPQEYLGSDPFTYKYIFPETTDFPRPPPEQGVQTLLCRLEVLKARFVECTREMASVLARVSEGHELEQLLLPIRERRDEIKKQLSAGYKAIDDGVLPRNYYHRIGVLGPDGSMDWNRYAGIPVAPDIRMSAPAAL